MFYSVSLFPVVWRFLVIQPPETKERETISIHIPIHIPIHFSIHNLADRRFPKVPNHELWTLLNLPSGHILDNCLCIGKFITHEETSPFEPPEGAPAGPLHGGA